MKLARGSKSSLFLWAALVLYAGVLVKVILFKNPGALQVLLVSGERMPLSFRMQSSNFMPFRTILHYAQGNPNMRVALQNLVGNILAFGPMGVLVPALLPAFRRVRNVILISLGVSLCFELTQLFGGIGQFDVDDLLLNTLGASIGWVAYWGFDRWRGAQRITAADQHHPRGFGE